MKFKPTSETKVIYDERLHPRFNEARFDNIDKCDGLGLPILDELKVNKGKRGIFLKGKGLVRVYLDYSGSIVARNGDLQDSSSSGRVVFLSGEATTQKFLADMTELREKAGKEHQDLLKEAEKAHEEYLSKLGTITGK